jgi:hypothetical protein
MRLSATVACLAFALGSFSPSLAASAQTRHDVQKALAGHRAQKLRKAQKSAVAKAAMPVGPAQSAEPLSGMAAEVTNWVIASGDNGGLPFMVIDKVAAEVAVFDGEGQPLGATPALFGITPGDDSSPGIGDRELSDIPPEERTTPAGRFLTRFEAADADHQVLWVDYETAISLHPVVTTNKKEHRLQRLNSPSPSDNRITFGCINVPARFYTRVVLPHFRDGPGVVYILPETKPLQEVFPAFEATELPPPFPYDTHQASALRR